MSVRRTTIELDEQLLARAKRALGQTTTRSTVEEALRRVVDSVEAEREQRAFRQRGYWQGLSERADLDVLGSEQMWR